MINHIFIDNNYCDLNIYSFGMEKCAPGHFYGPAMRSHYLFHYVINGKGVFCTDLDKEKKEYHLTSFQGFLIQPEELTFYQADPGDPWEYMWLEFDGLMAKSIVEKTGLSHSSPVFTPKPSLIRAETGQFLRYIIEHPTAPTIELLGYAYLFFNSLIQTSSATSVNYPNDLQQFYVQSAIHYIENNYMNPVTVSDIAQDLNLTRNYFSSLFRERVQKTPQEFLIEFRIKKACQLLDNTSLSIKEIAELVGYPNQFHFTRAFKSVIGEPPREWRKKRALSGHFDSESREN